MLFHQMDVIKIRRSKDTEYFCAAREIWLCSSEPTETKRRGALKQSTFLKAEFALDMSQDQSSSHSIFHSLNI